MKNVRAPAAVDTDAVWRVKGSSILNRPALAILREIWQWREKEAIAYCRPPFFVLSHERMVDISDAAAAAAAI
ncbi:MAG: HRDC domain-containing protein [Limisphaerales bacterium]